MRRFGTAFAAMLLALSGGCTSDGATADNGAASVSQLRTVTIESANGAHVFKVEVARTAEEQKRGLMFRTDIPENGGMLFAPYPAGGGAPQEASFWMKDTPSALDLIFIRADGTVARIAENAIPYDPSPITSGEPVSAVLEIRGGRAADLGIAQGDKVRWQAQ